jgi:L-fuconolactonase
VVERSIGRGAQSGQAGRLSYPSVDAHQHFWKYDPAQYPWIQADWPLRRDFLPPDLGPHLRGLGFDGCVAVQARQTLEETEWLLSLAAKYDFIKCVVGWVDLRSEGLDAQLECFARNPKFKGVRHVLQDEPDDRFMLREDFLRGIVRLAKWKLTYDILIFPRHIPFATELARRFPHQPFVLDHMAKPAIAAGQFTDWARDIRELARCENVFCKMSGLVTEASWRRWKPDDFRFCLETVWTAFSEDRLMIGSDWPVCLLSGDYAETMNLALEFLAQFSAAAREKVIGGNACRFYGIPNL